MLLPYRFSSSHGFYDLPFFQERKYIHLQVWERRLEAAVHRSLPHTLDVNFVFMLPAEMKVEHNRASAERGLNKSPSLHLRQLIADLGGLGQRATRVR